MSIERILGSGDVLELVEIEQPSGKPFEIARRPPGVRLIINDRAQRKLLLTKEFRHELNGYDYRLPGGKVYDEIKAYKEFLANGGDILEPAIAKAKEEGLQEAGIVVKDLKLFKKSTLGATVEWDLFIFEITDYEVGSQELEEGEDISADEWFSYDQVQEMILTGQMQEDRVALILLQWLHANA